MHQGQVSSGFRPVSSEVTEVCDCEVTVTEVNQLDSKGLLKFKTVRYFFVVQSTKDLKKKKIIMGIYTTHALKKFRSQKVFTKK